MKYYNSETLKSKFYKLSRVKQIDILWAALDMMNQYNGRGRWECVFLALGYEYVTEGKYKLQTE